MFDKKKSKKNVKRPASSIIYIKVLALMTVTALILDILTDGKTERLPEVKYMKKSMYMRMTQIIEYLEQYGRPADMWRIPRGNDTLKLVDLPNCCHDYRASEDAPDRSRKYLMKCEEQNITLRYFGPDYGFSPDDLKTSLQMLNQDLIFIGDSLTRQWFEQLSCYLGSWDSWQGFGLPPKEQKHHNHNFETEITELMMGARLKMSVGKYSAVGFFEMPSTTPGEYQHFIYQKCYRNGYDISIANAINSIHFFNYDYPRHFNRKPPIFVINIGLHYNIGWEKNETTLRHHLESLVRTCHDVGAQCIFRETSPQHFMSSANDGLYEKTMSTPECMQRSPMNFETLNPWRKEILHDVVNEMEINSSEEGYVKIMPLFDRLVHLTMAHNKKGDCTHFSSDPEYWEPWHVSLTQVLQDILNSNSQEVSQS